MSPVYNIMLGFAGKILSQSADPTILLGVLSCNSNIVGSEIIDTYLLEGKKSVTYRISILVYKILTMGRLMSKEFFVELDAD